MHMTVSIYYTSYDWSNGKERVSLGLSFCSLLLSPAYQPQGPSEDPRSQTEAAENLQVLMDGPKAVWLQNMPPSATGLFANLAFDPVCTSSESHSDFNFQCPMAAWLDTGPPS